MTSPHQPSTGSPTIDSFLRGARLRRLQGTERREAIRALFAEERAGDEPADPFDLESKPYRIMAMWRLVRTMAMVKGLCAEDETLDAATEHDPDPWVTPLPPVGLSRLGSSPLRRARVARVLRIMSEGRGLPLLPPRERPVALERWCSAASIVAADLGVERSREGLLGLQGLLDPKQCCRCDVRSQEVIAFEEMMLVEALDLLLDHGERTTIKHFRQAYGFSNKEAQSLLRVTKTQALQRSAASIEEKRALMEMRLESMLGRYKETMDMDGELKAVKELSKIQGLTRTEPENQADEIFQVVRAISAKQDRELLDSIEYKRLDIHRAEEVEAITIEPIKEHDLDDAEALAEYDREN